MASPPDDKPAADGAARPRGADLRHDLRTPINQIIGYSEMLEEDAAEAGQAKMSGDLKRIAEAARRMLELIDRIPDQLTAPSPAPPPAPARAARPAAADVPLPSEDGPGPATLALRAAVSKTRGESGGTLLVVDDNELNRDMLSRRLRSRGYEVVTAEDGQNALDLVKSRRFDLILLDIMMPV